MMQPITKWAIQADCAERIPELIAMGFHKALGGRPGPVYIDLPLDVLREEIEEIEVRPAIRGAAAGAAAGRSAADRAGGRAAARRGAAAADRRQGPALGR